MRQSPQGEGAPAVGSGAKQDDAFDAADMLRFEYIVLLWFFLLMGKLGWSFRGICKSFAPFGEDGVLFKEYFMYRFTSWIAVTRGWKEIVLGVFTMILVTIGGFAINAADWIDDVDGFDDMSFGDDSRGEICTVWSDAVYYNV